MRTVAQGCATLMGRAVMGRAVMAVAVVMMFSRLCWW
jgi:hypothetical protein